MKRIYFLSIILFVAFESCKEEEVEKKLTAEVSTLAGSTVGFQDGTGAAAKFDGASGMTVDINGNVFVADLNNNAIRKITPAGVVTTFAGGTEGDTNGTGTAAQFNGPYDIEIGVDGNFYVVEVYGNRIRKITPEGAVSNFAGSVNSILGYANAVGEAARFNTPSGITITPDGNMYVAEYSNRIRKITPQGVVTTFAGSGTKVTLDGVGEGASFNEPYGLSCDEQGNLYVAQYQSSDIRKILPNGVVTTITNTIQSSVKWPADVAVDKAGNCFIGEVGSYVISFLSVDNIKSGLAGSSMQGYADGPANDAKFDIPIALHFDKTDNILYVSDVNRIRKITISR
jgi:sugar lactone lactonase YvrE